MTRAHRRISAFAVLAAVLLLAQIGALAHGYSHLRAKGDPAGIGTTTQICTECLSFTPLLSAVGAPDPVVIFHPPCAGDPPRTAVTSSLERRPAPFFRSRAPPRLV